MNKTLVSIDKIEKEFLHKWSRDNVMSEGVDAVGQFGTFYIKDLIDFIHQQILALLKELEGELPKKKAKPYFEIGIDGEKHWMINPEDEDYDKALSDIKAILEKKKKEIK